MYLLITTRTTVDRDLWLSTVVYGTHSCRDAHRYIVAVMSIPFSQLVVTLPTNTLPANKYLPPPSPRYVQAKLMRLCIMYHLDIIFRLWGHHGPGGTLDVHLVSNPAYLCHCFIQEWTALFMSAIKDSRGEQDMFTARQPLLLVWQVNTGTFT